VPKYYGGFYLLSLRSMLSFKMFGTHLKKDGLKSISKYLYVSKINGQLYV